MKYLKRPFLLIILVCFCYSSIAWWGTNGHRIVGEIAERHLNNKARRAVHEILGAESLGLSSTWADFIKSDDSFDYLSPWHYINLKKGMNYDEFKSTLSNDSSVDAYTKLNFLINELKNKELEREKKIMYLRLLVHITGDLHQPMHVSRADDLGGNRIRVLWFNDSTNLHSVWDDKLVEFQKLSYTEYTAALDHCSTEQCKAWQAQPMAEWFFESYQIADKLYSEITRPNQKLSYRYNFDHVDIMNRQLLKAGIRLAGLLNEIFG